ncbi:MAG: hypothetical protein AAFY02_18110 [Pseudomonadota bacterium]
MDLATIEIMREIAAIKGKRSADGTWSEAHISLLESFLVRALAMQQRAEEKAAALAASKPEK